MRLHSALWLALGTMIGCGAPGAPEIPPREEIGPPPEAAQPSRCVPPYPMQFGGGWFLLADLDRGEACYAYLERDECILGIFRDCTDDSEDPRQWQGRVDADLAGARAILSTVYEEGPGQSRLSRSPQCCRGEVHATAASAWSLMSCRRVQCENDNDVSHVGLYLERRDPDLDPSRALGPLLRPPEALLDIAFDPVAGRLYGVARGALYAVGADGLERLLGDLADGRLVAAAGGALYVADGATLAVRAPGASAFVPVALPAPIVRLAALDDAAIAVLEGGALARVAGGAVTATAAFAPEITGLAADGDGAWLTARDDPRVYRVDARLSARVAYDFGAHVLQTGDPVKPGAPVAVPGGVATTGRCHQESRNVGCVFEAADPSVEPRRFGLAGIRDLAALHLDPDGDRIVTVGTGGRVTLIERDSGRPRLLEQVRVELIPARTAYDPAADRLWVLEQGGRLLQRVDLATFAASE